MYRNFVEKNADKHILDLNEKWKEMDENATLFSAGIRHGDLMAFKGHVPFGYMD